MPTIGGPVQTTNFPLVRNYVYMKQRWAAAWEFQPYVKPLNYQYSAAPMVSRGEVLYDFGYMEMEDFVNTSDNGVPSRLYQPYRAGPWYVMIATQTQGQPESVHWFGQINEDEVTVDRPTVSSGKQMLTVFGFEHYLDRRYITESYVKQNSEEGKIMLVLPFNERHERGGQLFGNQSGLPDANNVYRFYDPTDTNPPGRWTNKEIIEYLLQYFVNTLPDGTPSPIQFRLAGQTAPLQQIFDTFDFAQRGDKPTSVWQALNQLIDRRKGLGFTLRGSGLPGTPVFIWVFSLVESPITAGGVTLPANGEQISFAIPTTAPYANLVGEIPLRYSTTNLFHSIQVEGEPIRVTGSFRKRQGTLTFGWEDALQTEYENQDDDVRSHDKYRSVFSYFTVPPDWNWYVLSAQGDAYNLLLTANNDGTVSSERNTEVVGYNYLKTFERDLPILEGYDYRVEPPLNKNPSTYPPEFVKLLVLLRLEENPGAGAVEFDPADEFYLAEKGSEQEDDQPSCSIRALDHTLGVEVKASPNYLIALNHFSAVAGHEGEEDETVDYDHMIVTASLYSDVRPRVRLTGISVPVPETKPRLTVMLPDCHYWYVAPHTAYDVSDEKIAVPFGANPVVRDDTSRLRQVAAYLRWWFSRIRQNLTIPIRLPGQYAQPGQMITQLQTAWLREPVNAVVTNRKVNFVSGTTEITTSYLELDNLISLLDDPQRRTRGTWGVKSARR